MLEQEKQGNEGINQNKYNMKEIRNEIKDVLGDENVDKLDDDLTTKLLDTFSNERNKACQRLLLPNKALGGKTPIDVLDEENGKQEVIDVLGRIDWGVFS